MEVSQYLEDHFQEATIVKDLMKSSKRVKSRNVYQSVSLQRTVFCPSIHQLHPHGVHGRHARSPAESAPGIALATASRASAARARCATSDSAREAEPHRPTVIGCIGGRGRRARKRAIVVNDREHDSVRQRLGVRDRAMRASGRRVIHMCAQDRVSCQSINQLINQSTTAEGTWSSWSAWTICTKSCDTGLSTRHRSCNNGQCQGFDRQQQLCNEQSCSRVVRLITAPEIIESSKLIN